jgi:hypothetical protein
MAVTEVLVVYDAGCGTCSRVARELGDVLRVPVRARSCRDPHVPGLPAMVRACRAPGIGRVRPDGTVRWRTGLRAAPSLLPLVRPRALPAAVRLLATALRTSARRHPV